MASTFMHHRSTFATALILVGAILAGGAAHADSKLRDQDLTRQAVERGEIRALADILTAIRSKLPGEVVGVEFERKKGRWYYELRVTGPNGRLFEVYVDAQTETIDRIKEK
jgi:uncharacterized membrane protein YkoI